MNKSCLLNFFRFSSAALAMAAAAAFGQSPAPAAQRGALLSSATFISATPAVAPAGGASLSARAESGSVALAAVPVFAPDLPDAPSSLEASKAESSSLAVDALQTPATATPNVAPKLTKYIPSGWTAQSITGHDKVLIGLRDLYSPLNFVAMVASAGYEHVLNGEPNYGTDRGAFGQRLGTAAIRESTQGLFTDSVFAPIFHEDPRYYVQGSSHGFFYRAMYAVTRPVITRTDSGKNSINGALLAGYAASAALTYAYYPAINQNFHDTASTYGGSIGGAALGFFVSEFSDDALKAIHLRKK